ncbi:MAG TPA: hypothetical protein VFH70_04725 [Acidimicrobiales bacterium]|nr:hypothetical protein [Acidimicrobiales bacterium]
MGRLYRVIVGLACLVMLVVVIPGTAQPVSAATSGGSTGYWLVASDGGVYQRGTTNFGGMRGRSLVKPVVGAAATTNGLGYWEVSSDGGVFSFGDAKFYGSTGHVKLNKPVVGMAADPVTGGYWLVASDGGVFSFNAPFFGSTGGRRLAQPVVGMAATPTGKGYWLVASDGGVFTFGDAGFYGSTGAVHLSRPVVGIAPTNDGKGYWLTASDGGVFNFGDAPYAGSAAATALWAPVVSISAVPSRPGYWLAGADGGVFTYGGAPFLGASGQRAGDPPIVAMIATAHGYPFPPGGTGYDISQWQCPGSPYNGTFPTGPHSVSVVQVSGGAINQGPNPCYSSEIAWAGANVSIYIFMDPLPSPPPPESLTGPAGTCAGNVSCESYNFGWYWARHWVNYSHGLGVNSSLWWLDVETAAKAGWSTASSAQANNSQVIAGAVAGLRSSGVIPGIYSTNYQWGLITGYHVSFPGIALWIPGAGNISGGTYSATSFCAGNAGNLYAPFAGGTPVLVQYGYVHNGYTGPALPWDQDYACP